MTWEEIINQHHVSDALHAAVGSGRIAHAYLFHGPRGTGKKAVAIAFAQALVCENESNPPCGKCNACSRVARLIHPDVRLVMPYPGEPKPDEITERFSLLADDPYAPVDFVHAPVGVGAEKQSTNKQITVTRDRIDAELLRPSSFKSVEGGYKVAILPDFEYVNTSGANAVLKLLEEPPSRTVFVLTSARPDRLLPTIVSRCQKLRFDRLSVSDLVAGLMKRFDLSAEVADPIARMADGSMARAIELASNQELLGLRLLVVDYFRDSWSGNIDGVHRTAQLLGGGGREQVKAGLYAMLNWLRDLVVYQTTGDASRLVNSDQGETIRRFLSNLPLADLPGMVEAVQQAINLVERNVNTSLILISLSNTLNQAMHGEPVHGLYEGLADA